MRSLHVRSVFATVVAGAGVSTLVETIDLARRAVELTPDDDVEVAGRLSNLAGHLARMHAITGEREPLTEAVEAGRRAVAATDDDAIECARILHQTRPFGADFRLIPPFAASKAPWIART